MQSSRGTLNSMTDPVQPFRDAIAALDAIADPTDRALAAAAVLDAVPDLQAEIRAVRQRAVATMRETQSVAEVAAALAISVPRVSQIVKGVSRTAKRTAGGPSAEA